MSFEMLSQLARFDNEENLARRTSDSFDTLCAPEVQGYLPIRGGRPHLWVRSSPEGSSMSGPTWFSRQTGLDGPNGDPGFGAIRN